jgi:hypothetical protein
MILQCKVFTLKDSDEQKLLAYLGTEVKAAEFINDDTGFLKIVVYVSLVG